MIKVILAIVIHINGAQPIVRSGEIASLEECLTAVTEILKDNAPPAKGSIQAGCVVVDMTEGA